MPHPALASWLIDCLAAEISEDPSMNDPCIVDWDITVDC